MGLLNSIEGDKVYIDTNIFIYAIEGFEPYENELGDLFGAIDNGDIQSATSELTLAESLVKPIEEEDVNQQQIYKETLQDRRHFRLIPVRRPILVESAHLRATTSLRLPDAIHLATAHEADCDTLITNDTGFRDSSHIDIIILSDVLG